jgi:hypothetical protein
VVLEGAGDRRSYWIYAINLRTGISGSDAVSLRYAAVPVAGPAAVAGGTSLVATGPGAVAAGAAFNLRLAWDAPAMLPGETWTGYVAFSATRTAPGRVGRVPVYINAASALVQSAQWLDPRGDALRLRLRPGVAHERIAVDLPPNATGLVVELANAAGVDLHVARSADPGSGPELRAAPPRSAAVASALGAAASKRVQLVAPQLQAGRWYLTPVNASGADADFILSVSASFAGEAPALRDSAYFNPSRSGHGVLLARAADQLAATWFTYRADGSPTWYIAQATAPAAGQGVWRAALRRSSWNGSSNQLTEVGEVIITRTAANAFTWTWKLDGSYGSEPFVEPAVPGCVEGGTRDYSGAWFAPARGGFGYAVTTLPSTEVQTAFLYDGGGNPVWLYSQVSPFGAGNFPLQQYSGFCPQCAAVQPTFRPVGTLVRSFSSQRTGSTAVDATLLPPLAGSWRTDDAVERISVDLACPR